MDAIFGRENFRNEISWQRTNAKGLASRNLPNNHDILLRYSKSEKCTWNPQFVDYDPDYVDKFYKYVEEGTGRRYTLGDLVNPNRDRPNLTYEFLGVTRVWRWTKERMQKAYEDGIVIQAKPGAVPRLKRYLDEQKGAPLGTMWTDIKPVQSRSKERTGYPTQKPIALLDRIIEASSNEGDIVFDPFCGCATTMVAADRLERQWAGIDLSPLAVKLVNERITEDRGALWGGANVVDTLPQRTDLGDCPTTAPIAIVSTASRKASASAATRTSPSRSWKSTTSCPSLAAAPITSIICNCYARIAIAARGSKPCPNGAPANPCNATTYPKTQTIIRRRGDPQDRPSLCPLCLRAVSTRPLWLNPYVPSHKLGALGGKFFAPFSVPSVVPIK